MKSVFLATALAFSRIALAQESAPLEEAQKIALKLEGALENATGAPLMIDPDAAKPALLKVGEGGGAMLVPDKKLSVTSFKEAGSAITPVGQLWLRKIALAPEGRRTPAEKIRTVIVTDNGKQIDVQFFLLGLDETASGALELVVFGNDKEPLFRLPLEKIGAAKQELPFELSGRKTGDETGVLTVTMFGEYLVNLTLMKPAE